MQALDLTAYHRIVVLTGAGLSGFPSDSGSQAGLQVGDAAQLWAAASPLRRQALQAEPNAAHIALAALPGRLPVGTSLTLLTFNQDGLHQRAGSQTVIELRGSLVSSRCTQPGCSLPPFEDPYDHSQHLPYCPFCGHPLRPDARLGGEALPAEMLWLARRALRDCDLFIAAGLGEGDPPVDEFLGLARAAGAQALFVGRQPPQPDQASWDAHWAGPPERLLPGLLGSETAD